VNLALSIGRACIFNPNCSFLIEGQPTSSPESTEYLNVMGTGHLTVACPILNHLQLSATDV
jgi:hypothetical protein